jgi:hypothetical protein
MTECRALGAAKSPTTQTPPLPLLRTAVESSSAVAYRATSKPALSAIEPVAMAYALRVGELCPAGTRGSGGYAMHLSEGELTVQHPVLRNSGLVDTDLKIARDDTYALYRQAYAYHETNTVHNSPVPDAFARKVCLGLMKRLDLLNYEVMQGPTPPKCDGTGRDRQEPDLPEPAHRMTPTSAPELGSLRNRRTIHGPSSSPPPRRRDVVARDRALSWLRERGPVMTAKPRAAPAPAPDLRGTPLLSVTPTDPTNCASQQGTLMLSPSEQGAEPSTGRPGFHRPRKEFATVRCPTWDARHPSDVRAPGEGSEETYERDYVGGYVVLRMQGGARCSRLRDICCAGRASPGPHG